MRTLGPRLDYRSPEFPVILSALPSGDACSGFRLPVFLCVFAGKTGTGIWIPEEISQELIALTACSANLTDDFCTQPTGLMQIQRFELFRCLFDVNSELKHA